MSKTEATILLQELVDEYELGDYVEDLNARFMKSRLNRLYRSENPTTDTNEFQQPGKPNSTVGNHI